MKSLNNTPALSLIFAAILLLPLASNAANQPCSGKKGGIARCNGAQFVCNDGTISKSQRNCSAESGNTSGTSNEPAKPITSGSTPAPDNAATGLPPTVIERTGNILKLGYQGFTVWLDCDKRGAVKFMYNAQHDTGNAKRADTFYLDPNVPPECQQTTAKAYGNKYDRGHQIPANHLDSSNISIRETNYMTNILPQTLQMNRGAWLQTEEIIECYRDQDELLGLAGAFEQKLTVLGLIL